jgi:hypothetical protein
MDGMGCLYFYVPWKGVFMAVGVGSRVCDEYLLEEELGRSALGVTYKAKRGRKKKRVVVKVLDSDDYAYLLKTRYGDLHVNMDAQSTVRGFDRVIVDQGTGYLVSGAHYERTLADSMASGNMRAGQVRQILLEVAKEESNVVAVPEPRVRFRSFGGSGLDFELLVWIPVPVLRGITIDSLNTSVYKNFAQANIEIPYSKHDIYVHQR